MIAYDSVLQGLPDHTQEALELIFVPGTVYSKEQDLRAFHPMNRWASLLPVPLHMVLDPTAPKKALLSSMDARWLLLRGDIVRDVLCDHLRELNPPP